MNNARSKPDCQSTTPQAKRLTIKLNRGPTSFVNDKGDMPGKEIFHFINCHQNSVRLIQIFNIL